MRRPAQMQEIGIAIKRLSRLVQRVLMALGNAGMNSRTARIARVTVRLMMRMVGDGRTDAAEGVDVV